MPVLGPELGKKKVHNKLYTEWRNELFFKTDTANITILQMRKWNLRDTKNQPKVTGLRHGGTETQPQVHMISKPTFLNLCSPPPRACGRARPSPGPELGIRTDSPLS